MRGFRNAWGISGRQVVQSIVILFTSGAVLFDGGCTGLVSGSHGGGNPNTLTISNAAAANATPTSVGIDWQTSAPANSQVEFGATTSYGSSTTIEPTMDTIHQLTGSGLNPGTPSHCREHSPDAQSHS